MKSTTIDRIVAHGGVSTPNNSCGTRPAARTRLDLAQLRHATLVPPVVPLREARDVRAEPGKESNSVAHTALHTAKAAICRGDHSRVSQGQLERASSPGAALRVERRPDRLGDGRGRHVAHPVDLGGGAAADDARGDLGGATRRALARWPRILAGSPIRVAKLAQSLGQPCDIVGCTCGCCMVHWSASAPSEMPRASHLIHVRVQSHCRFRNRGT